MRIADPLRSVQWPVQAAWNGAGAIISRLDRVLSAIEQLAGSITSIEDDMRGMRRDIAEVVVHIDALRESVLDLHGAVGGIRDATTSLDGQVDDLAESLQHLDALARSFKLLNRRALGARREREQAPIAPVQKTA